MQYIKIHALDNVAVALADLAEGTEVTVDGQAVTLRQAVSRGHKFALRDIAKGENVIKYGLPIVIRWWTLRRVSIFMLTTRALI